MKQLKSNIDLYKGKYLSQINELYKEINKYLSISSLDIHNEMLDYQMKCKKINIINKNIRFINANKSKQAEIKSQIISSIPIDRKEIISLVLEIFKNKKIKDNMDLSINKYEYNSEKIINEKENIVVKEYLEEKLITEVNEKNNEVFNTYGKKGELNQNNNYNLKDKSQVRNLLDTYIKKGVISSQRDALSEKLDVVVEVLFDGQDVKKLNPGSIAKKYIELYFDEQVNSGDKNVVLFDQIENDVDKDFINNVIRNLIEDTKGKVQVIIVTHDPIVAVNADPNNYIESKKNGDIIEYRNFVAESSLADELETIACTVDGSKDVIRGRYEIYEGDKNYGN